MQKTSNFSLNQWEATDPIRREDFNADNAAIDAAIKAVEQRVEVAWSPNNTPWVFGTLDLTGVEEGDVVATFDFAPTAILLSANVNISGFAVNGGRCTVRKHTSSGYHTFLLSGKTLTVTTINGEPTTTVQYMLLK